MTKRRALVAGNWKMYTSYEEALALAEAIGSCCASSDEVEVVIIPPFPWIVPLAERLRSERVAVGAQTCSAYPEGAYTGEVSARMLAPFCQYVIVGHSERRRLFGETDAVVAAKLRQVLEHGLHPILCVGETLEEREGGQTIAVVERQLAVACGELSVELAARLVVAYEPVWAIGTGRSATPSDSQAVARWIRNWFAERYPGVELGLRILYGGSVTPQNAVTFFKEADIDGALVGGASLKADSFCSIAGEAVSVYSSVR